MINQSLTLLVSVIGVISHEKCEQSGVMILVLRLATSELLTDILLSVPLYFLTESAAQISSEAQDHLPEEHVLVSTSRDR